MSKSGAPLDQVTPQRGALPTDGAKRLRFPRAARLTATWEFKRVREKGRSWPGKFMVLGVLVNATEALPARVGFVTSKRVGGAVVRNTVRRRLREAVRAVRPRLLAGHWVVVVARYTAGKASADDLSREWLRLAQRASILAPVVTATTP